MHPPADVILVAGRNTYSPPDALPRPMYPPSGWLPNTEGDERPRPRRDVHPASAQRTAIRHQRGACAGGDSGGDAAQIMYPAVLVRGVVLRVSTYLHLRIC